MKNNIQIPNPKHQIISNIQISITETLGINYGELFGFCSCDLGLN
jgi:hypothetical protein